MEVTFDFITKEYLKENTALYNDIGDYGMVCMYQNSPHHVVIVIQEEIDDMYKIIEHELIHLALFDLLGKDWACLLDVIPIKKRKEIFA